MYIYIYIYIKMTTWLLTIHTNRFQIWQVPRQQCYRDASQISGINDHCDIQYRGIEASRDLVVIRLTALVKRGPDFHSKWYIQVECWQRSVARVCYTMGQCAKHCRKWGVREWTNVILYFPTLEQDESSHEHTRLLNLIPLYILCCKASTNSTKT